MLRLHATTRPTLPADRETQQSTLARSFTYDLRAKEKKAAE